MSNAPGKRESLTRAGEAPCLRSAAEADCERGTTGARSRGACTGARANRWPVPALLTLLAALPPQGLVRLRGRRGWSLGPCTRAARASASCCPLHSLDVTERCSGVCKRTHPALEAAPQNHPSGLPALRWSPSACAPRDTGRRAASERAETRCARARPLPSHARERPLLGTAGAPLCKRGCPESAATSNACGLVASAMPQRRDCTLRHFRSPAQRVLVLPLPSTRARQAPKHPHSAFSGQLAHCSVTPATRSSRRAYCCLTAPPEHHDAAPADTS